LTFSFHIPSLVDRIEQFVSGNYCSLFFEMGVLTLTSSSQGTDASHAVGDSIVPKKLQEVLPQKVEEKVPNSLHDTGADADTTGNAGVTHATGDSVVPKPAQEAVPKGLENALPEKVHPTT